ncbi:nucleotidyltransferase family protein [Clostridium hydrogenum]|uniref:nucleotidyltransferase family protein n=1 Tax=Clostridium hydrogenum TaxID=2855764 RepID=UPI002E375E58|nr:NTP transferase domain-containing protein [Clostridium hydrogenum]
MSIDGVILAAGLSSRMGNYKMTLELRQKTIIENCIEAIYDYCSNIIVVGGYNYNMICEVLKPYRKITTVLNENYKDGMFSSIKTGLKNVRGNRFFITPGDYPLIKKDTCEKMIKCKADIVIPVYDGEKGHPVLINSNLINDVLENDKYESMKDFINSHNFKTVPVKDKGILMDADTPEDYAQIRIECQ